MTLKKLMLKAEKIIIKKLDHFNRLGSLVKIALRCNEDDFKIEIIYRDMHKIGLELEPGYAYISDRFPKIKELIDHLNRWYK